MQIRIGQVRKFGKVGCLDAYALTAQDKRDVASLRSHGVQVRQMPGKPIYVHAKAVISRKEVFVGSENFTETSLDANREMGLLLNGRPVSELQAQFNQDWARVGPSKAGRSDR